MILFHGGIAVVEHPDVAHSRKPGDFGTGFYTTTNEEQAAKWALVIKERRNEKQVVVSVYDLNDLSGLSQINYPKPTSDWLDFVCSCRRGVRPYGADVINGPVADDKIYETIVQYETGAITKEEAIKRFKVQETFNQLVFTTDIALQRLKFIRCVKINTDN